MSGKGEPVDIQHTEYATHVYVKIDNPKNLGSKFEGPYEILERPSRSTVTIKVGTKQNKNLARLIPALAGLPCRLQIIGHLSDNMIKQLAQFRITYDNWSNLSLTEVVKKYEQCDLLAFCSTYEGFGMPIVEANAVGRAVVTSNCTSMPEVAGEAACLVNPNSIASIRDGIQKVINDDGFRNKIITQGISNAKRFDPEVIAKQYLSLYEEIAMNR